MTPRNLSPEEKRANWWDSQRNSFGLPDALYAPLPIALLLIIGLGIGSSFLGLYPGVDTHEVTLSGVGAPWLGVVILLVIAALWYGVILHRGYSLLMMGLITLIAALLSVAVTQLSLDTLAPEYPDAFIGGLGLALLMGAVLVLMGLVMEDSFILSLLIGGAIGLLMAVLAGFVISFDAILIMILIYGPLGIIGGGIGGLLRLLYMRLRWPQRYKYS
ncbi:MAG: hypothetical protein KC708_14285 [Anaerolineae bacterium]|nr:hypothetical protein [Anaerolineae bacterium]